MPPIGSPLADPVRPILPDSAVDAVVGDELHKWLTPIERWSLAEASEQAAAVATGAEVVWQAKDGTGAVTAEGTVLAARDVYLSHRGYVCRDLQQRVEKGAAPRATRVTLCRADLGNGLALWMPASPD
jgi:surface antigen